MSPGPVVEAAEPETLLQTPTTDEPQKTLEPQNDEVVVEDVKDEDDEDDDDDDDDEEDEGRWGTRWE